MAFDFPASPTNGQTYPATPVAGKPTYTWDGEKWVGTLGGPATAPPLMDGTAAVGASVKYTREDHVHPSDTSRVSKAGDAMTGHLALPTAPAAANAVRKDYVDNAVSSINLTGYVAKSGDTMTGPLNVNSTIGATGNITSNGSMGAAQNITANNTLFSYYGLVCQGYYGGYQVDAVSANPATGPMLISAIHIPGVRYQWRMGLPGGNPYFDFWSDGSAVSQNGGGWLAYSDARIKTITGNYESGLDQVAALKPVRYTFKGNNTDKPPDQPLGVGEDGKALPRTGDAGVAPYPTSGHYNAAVAGTEYIGLIAQEAEVPMPETVKQSPGYIDGAAVTDLRLLDTSPILLALVNAVKELKARVEELEAAP
jgi:hypothetical protein